MLPSTSGDHNALWVVLNQGCTPQDPTDCDLDRTVFKPSSSSTWEYIGLYQLGLLEESKLGYNQSADNAEFANETFTLGNNNNLPTIPKAVIQGFATKDFYMGALGLAGRAINVSSFNDPQPSFLQALRDQGNIPSLSWGYTAGSQNVDPPTFGSLTLGGYDSSRLSPNNVTVAFGADQSRDLLIAVQSISSGSSQLLSSGIFAFIDSLVAELWLPMETCEAFEQAFGLTWNDTAQLYLVNDSLHDSLTAQNPSVTFQLGPATSSSYGSVKVVLPYSAFDLSISPPYVSSESRYFPLKRANSSDQYTLGRTFLQHAYIVADYERSQFQVYQAAFPPTSVPSNITAIYPPGQGPSPTVSSKSKSGIGTGAIAGIAVAAGLILIGAGILAFFLLRRRKTKKTKAAELSADSVAPLGQPFEEPFNKPELDATTPPKAIPSAELETNTRPELDAGEVKGKPELDSRNMSTSDFGQAYEMESINSKGHPRNELPGSPPSVMYELPAEDVIIPELPTPPALSSHGSTASSQRGFQRGFPRSGVTHQHSIASRSSGALPSGLMRNTSTASGSSSGAPQSSVTYQPSSASRSSRLPQSGVPSVSRSSGAPESSSTDWRHGSIISPVSGATQSTTDPSSPPSVTRSPPPRNMPFTPARPR